MSREAPRINRERDQGHRLDWKQAMSVDQEWRQAVYTWTEDTGILDGMEHMKPAQRRKLEEMLYSALEAAWIRHRDRKQAESRREEARA